MGFNKLLRVKAALVRSLVHRGVVGTALYTLYYPGRKLKQALIRLTPNFKQWQHARLMEEEQFDAAYQVDTKGALYPDLKAAQGNNRMHGTYYRGVPPSEFHDMMTHLTIDHATYAFIDYGSGKGRALFLASDYPFKQIIGVEFAPELHAVAQQNMATYRNPKQQCTALELLCMDAAEHALPPESMVVFMNNPFGTQVIDQVLANLQRSIAQSPRDLWVVYQYPVTPKPFDDCPFLRLVMACEAYRIYRLHSAL